MKRIIPALALAALAGCTSARTDVELTAVVPPATDGGCGYPAAPGTINDSDALVEARVSQIVNGSLQLVIGLGLQNNINPPSISNSNGIQSTNLSPTTDNAAEVQEVDITASDLSGAQIASETLAAHGAVPGASGTTVIPVDVFGAPFAEAIRNQMVFPNPNPAEEQLLLSIVVKGVLTTGGSFETEPYTFPVRVRFDDPFRTDVSNGDVNTIAILADGGVAGEVIHSDGSQALLNDNGSYVSSQLSVEALADGGLIASPDFFGALAIEPPLCQ